MAGYAGSNGNGQLTRRYGYNPRDVSTSQVVESFDYGGRGGRLSRRQTSVGGSPNGGLSTFNETWIYNSLGAVSDHGLPIAGPTPDWRGVTAYKSGLPVSMTAMLGASSQNVVSASKYSPSGVLSSWTAGNGVVTTIAQDGSGLPRPASISTSGVLGGANFLTGSYSYDGSGNITTIGSDTFTYDLRSRLSQANLLGQTAQTFAYDRFGNLNPGNVDATTNRLSAGSGATYDGRGNLTGFGGQSHAYDELSRQISFNAGAERYLYDGAGERVARAKLVTPANDAMYVTVPPQSVPTTMYTGVAYPVSLTMKNTGTNTWTAATGYKLGSQAPQDNLTWGLNRVLLAAGDSIAPNGTKLFSFSVIAPATPGTYAFQWRMIREGFEWFGDFTPVVNVTVLPSNNASFQAWSFPPVMQASTQYAVSVTMRNTGVTTWTAVGGYQLGSLVAGDPWGSRIAMGAGDSIGQGQDKTFSFNVTAPSAAGTYSFQWRMIQGSTWFGASTPVGTITVNTTPVGTKFFTVTPCRLLDTRQTGQGPALAIGVERNVQVTGGCGVPVGAAAIAGNLTAVSPPDAGFVRIYPAGTFPATATINFNPVRTRANNFIVGLSPTGVASLVGAWGGTLGLHVIVDISGYFAPTGVGVVSESLQDQSISLEPEEERLPLQAAAPSASRFDETEAVLPGMTPNSVTRAAVLAPVETWYLTMRDEANRLSSEYVINPSSVTRSKQYFYFGSLLAATRDASTGAFVYYHSDHLGTPRLVTRQDKSVAETHKYRPFGEEIAGSFGNQPLKFATMEQDQVPGKFYVHARHLGMTGGLTGRFLSPDKLGGKVRNPQTWNRYVYAINNPLRYVDPDGRAAVGFTGAGNSMASGVRRIINDINGAPGIGTARTYSNEHRADAVRFLIREYRANPNQAIVLIGHSQGVDTALKTARDLRSHGVRVNLLITIDPVGGALLGRVPSNVDRAYNYYEKGDPATPGAPLKAESSETDVDNSEVAGVSHTEIDDVLADTGAVARQTRDFALYFIDDLLRRGAALDSLTRPPR